MSVFSLKSLGDPRRWAGIEPGRCRAARPVKTIIRGRRIVRLLTEQTRELFRESTAPDHRTPKHVHVAAFAVGG